MSDPHQTPLEEAISFLTIAAILVAVFCYVAAARNIPVASPALFWVASMVYHWIPGLDAIRAPQMAMLVSAAAVGGAFFVVGIPFRRLVSHVVCKRANGKPGAADGKASAEPGQGSKSGAAIAINMTLDRFTGS